VIGVYISIPFCAQKCTYCHFASGVVEPALTRDYVSALEAELAAEPWPEPPDTLYLGGGTPSLLDEETLRGILARLPTAAWREATIEASPGSVTAQRARHWRRLGLDRVSLGVQSFAAREISATGRKHSADEVQREVALLREAGLEKISVDLIAGLPHQTRASWRESLDWVERLAPPHVSVYILEVDLDSRLGCEILEGGARYSAGAIPEEEQVVESYLEAGERLVSMGLDRYEISNFARPGFQSLHNLKYWRLEPYRGFGADAHSYRWPWRWSNVRTAAEYVQCFHAGGLPVAQRDRLDHRQSTEERFFLGLRQIAGIEPVEEEWKLFAEPIARLTEEGLLRRQGARLRLTDRGILYSNTVFQEFLA